MAESIITLGIGATPINLTPFITTGLFSAVLQTYTSTLLCNPFPNATLDVSLSPVASLLTNITPAATLDGNISPAGTLDANPTPSEELDCG